MRQVGFDAWNHGTGSPTPFSMGFDSRSLSLVILTFEISVKFAALLEGVFSSSDLVDSLLASMLI
jgi:hypothetical protein